MPFTVHWEVNDGRCGYPNIVSELNWSDMDCKSYLEAVKAYAKLREVNNLFNISETNSKGKINGRCYKDFLVQYAAKNINEKAIYLAGECVSKIIRVFGKEKN
jgi:hypothetical protein